MLRLSQSSRELKCSLKSSGTRSKKNAMITGRTESRNSVMFPRFIVYKINKSAIISIYVYKGSKIENLFHYNTIIAYVQSIHVSIICDCEKGSNLFSFNYIAIIFLTIKITESSTYSKNGYLLSYNNLKNKHLTQMSLNNLKYESDG